MFVKYSKLPDGRLLPFIPAQQYNERIREVLRIVGIDRMVTIVDPLTGKEDKKPICEVAASQIVRMAQILTPDTSQVKGNSWSGKVPLTGDQLEEQYQIGRTGALSFSFEDYSLEDHLV